MWHAISLETDVPNAREGFDRRDRDRASIWGKVETQTCRSRSRKSKHLVTLVGERGSTLIFLARSFGNFTKIAVPFHRHAIEFPDPCPAIATRGSILPRSSRAHG
jgi:hypothetical protein